MRKVRMAYKPDSSVRSDITARTGHLHLSHDGPPSNHACMAFMQVSGQKQAAMVALVVTGFTFVVNSLTVSWCP